VIEALMRVAKRALNGSFFYLIAAFAFIALFLFQMPFPIVIVLAWLVGAVMQRLRPSLFEAKERGVEDHGARSVVDRLFESGRLAHATPSAARTVSTFAIWSVLWLLPIAALAMWQGTQGVHVQQSIFFSQAAVVTFGGAYSVLAYVAQRAVDDFGWLRPGEMLDGLGLAETTPGPLILVLQFVAYIGAFRHPGELSAMTSGLFGAGICLWVTFVPCFLWIFLGAPYIEALRSSKALNAGLKCITAAVVGVILNLSVWFALHVLFVQLEHVELGPIALDVPVFATLDVVSALLAAGAVVALIRFNVSMPIVLAIGALLGLVYRMTVS
jgi:chromate transporter